MKKKFNKTINNDGLIEFSYSENESTESWEKLAGIGSLYIENETRSNVVFDKHIELTDRSKFVNENKINTDPWDGRVGPKPKEEWDKSKIPSDIPVNKLRPKGTLTPTFIHSADLFDISNEDDNNKLKELVTDILYVDKLFRTAWNLPAVNITWDHFILEDGNPFKHRNTEEEDNSWLFMGHPTNEDPISQLFGYYDTELIDTNDSYFNSLVEDGEEDE